VELDIHALELGSRRREVVRALVVVEDVLAIESVVHLRS
jgi:hypothetical protein